MQSDSYWAGRGNTPGGNYDTFEYQRGQRDAKQWQELAGPQAPSKSRYRDDNSGGGGGAAGLAILFVLYVVALALAAAAVVAIAAGAIALVASVVVVLAARVLPGRVALPYGAALRATFWGAFGLLVVTGAVWFLTMWFALEVAEGGWVHEVATTATGLLRVLGDPASFEHGFAPLWSIATQYFQTRPEQHATAAYAVAWLVLPGLLTYALVLSAQVGGPFRGWLGFLQSFVTAVVSFVPGLVFAAWGGSELAERAEFAALGSESEAWGAVVVAAGLVLGYALIGGAVAARVLAGLAKVLGPPTGNASFYGASFLGFLAYGVLTVLALFAYRRGDAFLRSIYEAIGSSDWIAYVRNNLDTLSAVFWDFWPLQLAGLLACATILVVRLRGPYSGVFGYAKACVVSGLIALPLCLPFVVLGLLAVRSGVLEEF